MTFQIRAYQQEAHVALRRAWGEGVVGALLVMATGSGKTATALDIVIKDYLARGLRVAWLAHREELLTQPRSTVEKFWPEYAHRVGIVQASNDEPTAQLVLASVATLAMSPHRVDAILAAGPIDLVVVDEAHHSTSPTQQAAIEALGAPRMLGLTATPDRQDGADLSEHWEIVFSYGILDAIRDGALVEPFAHVARLPDLDLSRVSGRRDYDDGELGAELLRAGVVDHTVAMMNETLSAVQLPDREGRRTMSARGRSCLVFTATVDQAMRTAEALREAGWKARHISGKTPRSERRRLLAAYRRGLIDVLCNAAVLTEGTDLPRASCVVFARPTRSWSLFVQCIGRGLRLFDGKEECFVLDLAGATEDHSLISAPVLIGGSRCPKSPNGNHDLHPSEDVRDGAKCSHCGKRVPCGANLGAHTYGIDHKCSACHRPQCVESETGAHEWIPQADHKRRCLDCGVEIPDPLAGMVSDRSKAETVEADWIRLPNLSPETYVVDLEPHGLLFVVGDRKTATWTPVWLVKGGRRPRPLVSAPVDRQHIRGLANDLVRRAARVAAKAAPWKNARPRRYDIVKAEAHGVNWKGESAGVLARRTLRVRARERAIKTGISKEPTWQNEP